MTLKGHMTGLSINYNFFLNCSLLALNKKKGSRQWYAHSKAILLFSLYYDVRNNFFLFLFFRSFPEVK